MPRHRHARPAILALALAVTVGLTPHDSGRVESPVDVQEVAGAALPLPDASRHQPRVRLQDPDGRLDLELGAPRPASPAALTGYRWPLPRGRLTLPFGPTPWGSRLVDGRAFHDGIDLATFCGDRIVAAHDGIVLAAGRHYDAVMGWQGDLKPYLDRLEKKHLWLTLPLVVLTDDGNGYRSIYAHFGRLAVKRGQRVKAGQLLGHEGATGRASGCHLHFGLFSPLETALFEMDPGVVTRMKAPRYQIARIDPLLVLPPRPAPTGKAAPPEAPAPPGPTIQDGLR